MDVADSSETPIAGDSVRFVWEGNFGYYALMDLAGNPPNPKEKGRIIEGRNPMGSAKIPIAELDPNGDVLGDAIEKLCEELGLFCDGRKPGFKEDKPVALIPVPDNWDPDSVKKYLPGSVGQLFKPDVNGELAGLENVDPENIVFHAQAYYYTNLGTFVVESKHVEIKCNDPIFKVRINGVDTEDCRDSRAQIYLAWNLKDAKNRWVGTGAYVEMYDFYWKIESRMPNSIKKKIEMLGVKRIKPKK
jgi:hypothetical protein